MGSLQYNERRGVVLKKMNSLEQRVLCVMRTHGLMTCSEIADVMSTGSYVIGQVLIAMRKKELVRVAHDFSGWEIIEKKVVYEQNLQGTRDQSYKK